MRKHFTKLLVVPSSWYVRAALDMSPGLCRGPTERLGVFSWEEVVEFSDTHSFGACKVAQSTLR